MQANMTWRELFIRFSLIFICVGFWRGSLNSISFSLLGIAWLMDGGLYRFNQIIKEPFVQAILLLCVLLLLGLLWGELPEDGRMKWLKYFILLIFIPFYALLSKERLPWVVGALVLSYLGVIALGLYYSLVTGEQGVPFLRMSYLSFSAVLGIGVIVATCLASLQQSIALKMILGIVALALLWMQFHQGGRVLLFATLIATLCLFFFRYRVDIKKFISIAAAVFLIAAIFAANSSVFQNRWAQVKNDIELLQQGNYSSSLGYRLAIWDVGVHGIIERPLLGHGTGAPERYFEHTILTYKDGIYKNLPQFQETSNYHNDWIEITMHIGMLGLLALLFLLRGWYQIFQKNQLSILGVGLLSYIFVAGLTDTFLIFSKAQILLLMVTAVAISWQKQAQRLPEYSG